MKIITAEAHRLLKLAAQDADLRADLRALAQQILAATEAAPKPPSSGAEPAPPAGGGAPHGPMPHGVAQVAEPEPLRELTLGRRASAPSRMAPAPSSPTRPEADEDELRRIEARCRSKAEAARRAAERQRRIREGTDLRVEDAPIEPEFVEWADRLTDCFYWLDTPDSSHPADPSLLDQVGGCFEALAEAVALVAGGKAHRGALERALPLVAEAQSTLRRALQRLNAPDDPD